MSRRTLACLLLVLPLLACAELGRPITWGETRTFAAEDGKLVLLELGSLDSDVRVVAGDAIEVEVRLEARASSERAAKRWVDSHTPTFEDSPARLEVRAGRRSGGGVFLVGSLHTEGMVRVTLPARCRLEVRTSSGDVALSGEERLTEAARVRTTSGDVTVRGGAHKLSVRASSGDLRVLGEPLALLEAETTSGDVELRAGAARALVDTSSGEVRLADLTGELSVHTTSGDLRADWLELPAGTAVRVDTSSGDVRLRLPESAAVRGRVRTSSGEIVSSVDGEWGRRRRSLELRGATAGAEAAPAPAGEVQLDVRTSSGDVSLRTD